MLSCCLRNETRGFRARAGHDAGRLGHRRWRASRSRTCSRERGEPLPNSTWSNASADLFTSPRARQVGDIVTVNIQIDDKAEFDNASDRSRRSSISAGLDYAFSFQGWNADGTGDLGLDSSSSSKGQGTIDRSEKLRLSVAAIVNEVLPNGNVVISGRRRSA